MTISEVRQKLRPFRKFRRKAGTTAGWLFFTDQGYLKDSTTDAWYSLNFADLGADDWELEEAKVYVSKAEYDSLKSQVLTPKS